LLNAAKAVTWGWFQGGFNLSITNAERHDGLQSRTTTVRRWRRRRNRLHPAPQPFQYYPSTANPTHARPSSTATIGTRPTRRITSTTAGLLRLTLSAGNLPAVVYLKAPAYQDGHPGYSDPIDEQNFIGERGHRAASRAGVELYRRRHHVRRLRRLVRSSGAPDRQLRRHDANGCRRSMARAFATAGAQQTAPPDHSAARSPALDGGSALPAQGRCGYGTRIPLLVISPYAKANYIDHTLVDQSSVLQVRRGQLARRAARIQPGGSFDTIANSIQNMMSGI
jgi:phospholipase C